MAALIKLLVPVIIACTGLIGIVAFLVAALDDPQGWMNSVVITTIDAVSHIFPSTPDNLKIGTILNNLGDQIPLVGRAVIYEIFSTITAIAGLALIVKIYKLIPFKAT